MSAFSTSRPQARLAALVFACVSGACSGDRPPANAAAAAATSAASTPAPAPPPGKALYERNCLACHGEDFTGDGPAAAGLPVKPANIVEHLGDHAYEEIVRRVAEGLPPAMPPALINREQIGEVLDYVWGSLPDSTRGRLRALQQLMAEEH